MKVKLNKIKSTFDISIGQFQEYSKLDDPTELDIVSIFYAIDMDAVKLISNKDIKKLASHVLKVLESEQKHILKHDGLGFENDLENMTAGAFYDAMKYAQSIDTIHLFTAVLYRPIKKDLYWWFPSKKYNLKDYKGTKGIEEKAKDLPLALYLSCNAFFLTLRNDFLTAIRDRFQQKNNQLNQLQRKKDYKGTGETLYHFMQLLEETTSSFSTKLQKNQSQK